MSCRFGPQDYASRKLDEGSEGLVSDERNHATRGVPDSHPSRCTGLEQEPKAPTLAKRYTAQISAPDLGPRQPAVTSTQQSPVQVSVRLASMQRSHLR